MTRPRVGMLCYGTEQGLSYLAKSFYDAGVIDEVLLINYTAKGTRPMHPEWYPNAISIGSVRPMTGEGLDQVLDSLDIMLFFETPFDWDFPARCSSYGVKTVCMPMHEWYPQGKADVFDLMLCPSKLDQDYFPGSPLFQPPVDPKTWQLRTEACRFVHNAGNIGHRFHKGTLEVLKAVKHIKSDLTLTIRVQDTEYFKQLIRQTPEVEKDPRVTIERGSIPYEDLYHTHDVAVVPEKFNGLSLPLQEARAAGLLVMTTDRYPANTWLPKDPLIPVASVHKARVSGGCLEFEESVVDPKMVALMMDTWYEENLRDYSLSGLEWARANSWEVKKPLLLEMLEGL